MLFVPKGSENLLFRVLIVLPAGNWKWLPMRLSILNNIWPVPGFSAVRRNLPEQLRIGCEARRTGTFQKRRSIVSLLRLILMPRLLFARFVFTKKLPTMMQDIVRSFRRCAMIRMLLLWRLAVNRCAICLLLTAQYSINIGLLNAADA